MWPLLQATQETRLNISDCIGGRANLEALISDHDYLEKPLLECLADNMVQVNMCLPGLLA